jgi:hypothetical protein
MKRFGLVSTQHDDFLTTGGLIITHHSKPQMEWLFPGARVTELPPSVPSALCAPIILDPEFEGAFDMEGNLRREAFRDKS